MFCVARIFIIYGWQLGKHKRYIYGAVNLLLELLNTNTKNGDNCIPHTIMKRNCIIATFRFFLENKIMILL